MCMENTTKSLYFLKYFYTGLSVRTTVCMIWFIFFQKYNLKYHLSAALGTVIKCPKGTGSTWEKKFVFFTNNIFAMEGLDLQLSKVKHLADANANWFILIFGHFLGLCSSLVAISYVFFSYYLSDLGVATVVK